MGISIFEPIIIFFSLLAGITYNMSYDKVDIDQLTGTFYWIEFFFLNVFCFGSVFRNLDGQQRMKGFALKV